MSNSMIELSSSSSDFSLPSCWFSLQLLIASLLNSSSKLFDFLTTNRPSAVRSMLVFIESVEFIDSTSSIDFMLLLLVFSCIFFRYQLICFALEKRQKIDFSPLPFHSICFNDILPETLNFFGSSCRCASVGEKKIVDIEFLFFAFQKRESEKNFQSSCRTWPASRILI